MWLAGAPHTMQIASVLVMYSAIASSCGIGSNGLPEVILVEAGDDHALALVGERVAHRRQLRVEELSLVDAHHLGVGRTCASSSRDERQASEGIRISLCEVM